MGVAALWEDLRPDSIDPGVLAHKASLPASFVASLIDGNFRPEPKAFAWRIESIRKRRAAAEAPEADPGRGAPVPLVRRGRPGAPGPDPRPVGCHRRRRERGGPRDPGGVPQDRSRAPVPRRQGRVQGREAPPGPQPDTPLRAERDRQDVALAHARQGRPGRPAALRHEHQGLPGRLRRLREPPECRRRPGPQARHQGSPVLAPLRGDAAAEADSPEWEALQAASRGEPDRLRHEPGEPRHGRERLRGRRARHGPPQGAAGSSATTSSCSTTRPRPTTRTRRDRRAGTTWPTTPSPSAGSGAARTRRRTTAGPSSLAGCSRSGWARRPASSLRPRST